MFFDFIHMRAFIFSLLIYFSVGTISSCNSTDGQRNHTIVDLSFFHATKGNGFREEQLQYQRVQDAYKEKEDSVKTLLLQQGIKDFNIRILFRVLKKEN